MGTGPTRLPEDDCLIASFHPVDAALIASLVAIVALAGFDSMVARLQREEEAAEDPRRASGTDHSSIRIEVATAIAAISSIRLLQVCPMVGSCDQPGHPVAGGVHLAFVVGAALPGPRDRSGRQAKGR